MIDAFWFVFNAIFSEFFIHIYLIIFSGCFLGKPKKLPKVMFLASTFVYLPAYMTCSYFLHGDFMAFAMENRSVVTVIDITLTALYYYFGFRPQKPRKIFMCAVVSYVCFMLGDLLSFVILYFAEMYTGIDFGIFTALVRTNPFYSLIFIPVGSLMYLFLFLAKRIYYKKLRFSGIITFAVFPVTQFLILHTFVIILQKTYIPKQSGYIAFLLAGIIVLSIVSNVVLLRVMKEAQAKEMLEQKVRFFEHYEGLSKQYQEQIETTSRDFSKLRHDFNNHMQVMTELIRDDCIEDASRLAEELKQTYSSHKFRFRFCENKIVNVILRQAAEACESKQILLETNCILPDEIAVRKVDLCSIMTNLLNNAIRACVEMEGEEKKITCSIWQTEDMIFFQVYNSKDNVIRKTDNRFISTQRNQEQHGFGIEIIQHIAESYSGTVSIEYSDASFAVIVQLNLPDAVVESHITEASSAENKK